MAVDTRNKRASILGIGNLCRIFPTPDGSVAGFADRQQTAGAYAGVATLIAQGFVRIAFTVREPSVGFAVRLPNASFSV